MPAHRRSRRANRPRLSSGGWGALPLGTTSASRRRAAARPRRAARSRGPLGGPADDRAPRNLRRRAGRRARRRFGTAPATLVGARRCRLRGLRPLGAAVQCNRRRSLDRRLYPRPTAGPSPCLRALQAQRSPAGELIVVDNSADATAAARGERVCRRALRPRAAGPGSASRATPGFGHCTRPLLAFTDDDVEVDVHWTAETVDAFARDPGAERCTASCCPPCSTPRRSASSSSTWAASAAAMSRSGSTALPRCQSRRGPPGVAHRRRREHGFPARGLRPRRPFRRASGGRRFRMLRGFGALVPDHRRAAAHVCTSPRGDGPPPPPRRLARAARADARAT